MRKAVDLPGTRGWLRLTWNASQVTFGIAVLMAVPPEKANEIYKAITRIAKVGPYDSGF